MEKRARWKRGEKVHTGDAHTVAKVVRLRILQSRESRMGIDVERQNLCRTGARGRQSQDAGPGANISHGLAAQVETVEEFREIFATQKEAGVEDRRPDAQAEARRPGRSDALAAENEVIREEMNEVAQKTAERPVRRSAPIENGEVTVD